MEDYENNRIEENETAPADAQAESPAAENERTDDLNGASAGNGYTYHSDGTYSYARPAAPQPEQTERYDGANGAQSQDHTGNQARQNAGYQTTPPQYSGQYGAPQNPQQPGNAYPYQNNPYPYQNSRKGYAYDDDGKQKKSNGGKIFGIVTGALCLVLIAALVLVIVFGKKDGVSLPDGKNNTAASEDVSGSGEDVDEVVTDESPEAVGKTGSKDELTAKEVYRKVMESSVGILVYNQSDSLASEGTGVLFKESNDGKYTYIVTCAHVISGNNGTLIAQLHDEQQYKAEIVGYDNRTDIGVLKIEKSGLKLAEIGDSSKLDVGDTVYAIGNPGGVEFANSFTGGMVSALDRPVNSSSSGYTMECIQHTAAINPGNSGGALVNVFGQVIGINSMKIVDDEYEGMGFSVPSSVFVDIVNNIITYGYVANRPKLGITYVAAQNYNSYGMFIALKELPKGSIVIYSIAEDSSLAGTEAKEGDMIVAVNGKKLDDPSYLPELVEKSNVGDELTLSMIRINKDYSYEEFEVKAKLVEDRGDTVIEQETTTQSPDDYRDYFKDYFDDYFGDFFH